MNKSDKTDRNIFMCFRKKMFFSRICKDYQIIKVGDLTRG